MFVTANSEATSRLRRQVEKYEEQLIRETQKCYDIAKIEREKGFDFSREIEIPRAEDLAGRTEKLLVDYLDGLEIAGKIRELLEETKNDRETTAIKMSIFVAKTLLKLEKDRETCADVALRVGLAILTEAVLVAPLEGIARSRILNNLDGSEFLSIYFTGPIRAAGGTGQALAVLIADMIRRELDIDRYIPTTPEVERVKEEFGLYRVGLQYKPTPEEIDRIVRACPVMINGESTEKVECAGYARVRNIDDSRVRGGVLLVIGEGLCLKAPKLRKHTERLGVAGWDFISEFADKSSGSEEVSYWIDDGKIWLSSNLNDNFIKEAETQKGIWNPNKNAWGFTLDKEKEILNIAEQIFQVKPKVKSHKVKKIWKYMNDIIAGRPVLGDPSAPGGFRLRYGRCRTSGLAAGAINPVSMYALDDFLTIGTQMKIERPGKATAITPCDEIEGPWLLLKDGGFSRYDRESEWNKVKEQVILIWDAGEILLGYGEFLENNKSLVPSGYGMDRWSSELIRNLDTETKLNIFCNIMKLSRDELPKGLPTLTTSLGNIWAKKLRSMKPNWKQTIQISKEFKTSLCPPFNLWWKDLPLEWIPLLDDLVKETIIQKDETGKLTLKFISGCKNWKPENIPKAGQKIKHTITPGIEHELDEYVNKESANQEDQRLIHGIVKSSLMMLGIEHVHHGHDIIAISGWEALLDGLGYYTDELIEFKKPRKILDIKEHYIERISRLKKAYKLISQEKKRLEKLNEERKVVRIKAETKARQEGKSIAETVDLGLKAMSEIEDIGPSNFDDFSSAEAMVEEHESMNSLWLIKECSKLRIVDGAGTRIGCRMGRPEKAAPREMKPAAHVLFPLGSMGGPQKLLGVASNQENLRMALGSRICTICKKESPSIKCTNIDSTGEYCDGNTIELNFDEKFNSSQSPRKRTISMKTVYLKRDLEYARKRLGLDRLPNKIKGIKKLESKGKIPEPLEKGILRAKYNLPVFRDGTIRYDMSDVPLTHFTPLEINTSHKKLLKLGYTHDIHGEPLNSEKQVVELFPQDFVISKNCMEFMSRVANFIDDLLEKYYLTNKFYNINSYEDLVGQLIIGLAPHTSGGVLGRIIGWSDTSGGYAHPLYHAAKRRNCDGDEDCIMLLMDGLLNFSRQLLPNRRGGLMDAPLVLTTRLNPHEIDKEALNVDAAWNYSAEFYEATDRTLHSKEIENMMGTITSRLKKGQFVALRGLGFTHGTQNLSSGPSLSSYKTLETMKDKMNGQLALGHRLRSVDVSRVASTVVRSHFLPDLRGNLLAFTRQKVRCTKCGHSYRRMPLAGKCILKVRHDGQGLRKYNSRLATQQYCGGGLALTVSQGAVRKYIEITKHVIETYGVDNYTKQNVEWLVSSTDSLFNNDKSRQLSLSDFI